ncbi:hypothetical protein OK351_11565 [Glutamicibacter sp. MNS18]|uniref:hypothetical protein n=1 Tax=Glutamicibacter sp. MNS18 TaxID=2989817 RepID=UPI0022356176|nr:hypothetical protein [Glutamicibacter sp. MNS18]MCW4466136.1 hypothetical protein [Glutamicibacter sp. MNS18]
MTETQRIDLDVLASRISVLPTKLHKENQELKRELAALYAREEKLLKLIHTRDSQLAQLGKRDSAPNPGLDEVPEPAPVASTDYVAETENSSHGTGNSKELVNLRRRYQALSQSKLGRVQLWYWRLRAGK